VLKIEGFLPNSYLEDAIHPAKEQLEAFLCELGVVIYLLQNLCYCLHDEAG
jgi:hypothetical protein